ARHPCHRRPKQANENHQFRKRRGEYARHNSHVSRERCSFAPHSSLRRDVMPLSPLSRLAVWLGALALVAQPRATLVAGRVLDRQLSASETHAYGVSLKRGDYVQVTIGQRGMDVAATLTRPDGGTLLAVDACDDNFGEEHIVVIADVDGDYVLTI